MSDERSPDQSDLVPSGSRRLTTRPSGLVRRGLDSLRNMDQGLEMRDVTPLSLRIEREGGITSVVIERNTVIPVRRSLIFSTTTDLQTSIEIHVLQGESLMAADNKSVGKFIIKDIPTAPRGIPQIEVTFDIDTNGILHISAKDLHTEKRLVSTIKSRGEGLSEVEIKQMLKNANIR